MPQPLPYSLLTATLCSVGEFGDGQNDYIRDYEAGALQGSKGTSTLAFVITNVIILAIPELT